MKTTQELRDAVLNDGQTLQQKRNTLDSALADYTAAVAALAVSTQELETANQLDALVAEVARSPKLVPCYCRSAPMGSTFCETCKHDLGCPVHNAAPCRRPE